MSEKLRSELENVVKGHFTTEYENGEIVVGIRNDENKEFSLFIANDSKADIWTSLLLEDVTKIIREHGGLEFIIEDDMLNIFEA